jgi:hypothetical protein
VCVCVHVGVCKVSLLLDVHVRVRVCGINRVLLALRCRRRAGKSRHAVAALLHCCCSPHSLQTALCGPTDRCEPDLRDHPHLGRFLIVCRVQSLLLCVVFCVRRCVCAARACCRRRCRTPELYHHNHCATKQHKQQLTRSIADHRQQHGLHGGPTTHPLRGRHSEASQGPNCP